MLRQPTPILHLAWIAALIGSTSPAIAAETGTAVSVRSTEPDWPQWRGPRRDGVCEETGLLPSWPTGGPKCPWTAAGIGKGYSSPIVANETIYITGDKGDKLSISALGLDGSSRWETTSGASWTRSHPGSRASCTYDDGQLYHMNAHGRVACLDADTGREVWSVNALDRFDGKNITWGISESLLVYKDRVFVTPAGAKGLVAALDKRTGATIWATPPLAGEAPSYASPILIAVGKRHILVTAGARYAFAVDADTGELCWHTRHMDPEKTIVSTPVLLNNRLVFTNVSRRFGATYSVRADGGTGERAWSAELSVGHGGLVGVDNRVVGASGRGVVKGWMAIDPDSGSVTALSEMRPGSVVYADERYYCLLERGTMTLQKLTDDGFRMTGSFEFSEENDVWAHPVICQGRLYLRYHDTLFCYDIRR